MKKRKGTKRDEIAEGYQPPATIIAALKGRKAASS